VALADLLLPFPAEMLTWWAAEPTGHVLIGDVSSVYQLGPTQVRGRSLTNVAWIALRDLSHAHVAVFSALANLFDHLLGCSGEMEGAWLSEGGGITLRWQEVGQRVSKLSWLGYAPHGTAGSPRDYFAWGIALYCTDRRALNVADPRIERLLRTTVMNGEFWRQERGR
jgi:hypothetical protein